MAEHAKILRQTEEARLDQLYQTKCDEVTDSLIVYLIIGWSNEHQLVLLIRR